MIQASKYASRFLVAVALVLGALHSSPSATHSWNGYHWARTANPFTINLGNNMSSDWQQYLVVASADWSASNVLDTTIAAGGTTPKNCRPTAGRVEVCNSNYRNTGWLGIAQIWVSGTHITQGTTKVNDYYFAWPQYSSNAWRQFVTCQEIGHTFGLAHQDENFSNVNLGSCMDYTNDPDGTIHGWLDNTHPNAHDYEELEIIYNSHLDASTTIKSSPGASGVNLDSPSEWGQSMRGSRGGGRTQVFERDFGNGQRVVTFVIWA